MTRSPTPCRASRLTFKLPMPALHLHFMNKIVDQLQRMHAWAAALRPRPAPLRLSRGCVCTFTLKAAPAAAATTSGPPTRSSSFYFSGGLKETVSLCDLPRAAVQNHCRSKEGRVI